MMGTLTFLPLYDPGKSRQYSGDCRAVVDKSGVRVNIRIIPLLTFLRFSLYIHTRVLHCPETVVLLILILLVFQYNQVVV